jgi:hypothetical protein
MKKLVLVISIIFSVYIPSSADSEYTNYRNDSFRYTITVPSSWNLYDLNTEKRHILYVYPNNSVMIKVKALKSTDSGTEDVLHNKSWNLWKIDSRLNKIIETENIQVSKNIEGKLLVFEYRKGKNTVLQRVLITRSNDSIFIIECRAPVYSFYKYDAIFNNALASFACNGKASSSEKPDAEKKEKKDEEKPGKDNTGEGDDSTNDSEW